MSHDKPTELQPGAGSGALRILGRANSFNVRKVLWLCDEIGVPYTREDYGRGFQPTNTPEFLRLNPAAQVPVVLSVPHTRSLLFSWRAPWKYTNTSPSQAATDVPR